MPESGRGPKVYALTPNPAVDVTYTCPQPVLNEVNRVSGVTRRPGGKGLNVASVVMALGYPVQVGGFLGGRAGTEIRELLEGSGIVQDWVGVVGGTRTTVAVHADSGTTMFNEPGPTVTTEEWRALEEQVARALEPHDVLVVSGSCPPGTDPDDFIRVLDAARGVGVRTIVDTSGPMLIAARGHADILKPNREELCAATHTDDVQAGAAELLDGCTAAVVVSDGESGMKLFRRGEDRYTVAAPPETLAGNPTGAGDAAAAALAVHLLTEPDHRAPQVGALASAVALSASAVLCPTAGAVDLDAYQKFLPQVEEEYRNATHNAC